MTTNKLKLNDSKTEVLLVKSSRCAGLDPSITSVMVGESEIPFASFARDLEFILTSNDLSLKKHVSEVCRAANYQIRRIGSIRDCLNVEASKTLVSALVLSRLDLLNGLLSGCNKDLIKKTAGGAKFGGETCLPSWKACPCHYTAHESSLVTN